MLPFLYGIVWQTASLGERLAGKQGSFWLLPLVMIQPVLLGQSVLISPDVVLAFLFLTAFNAVLKENKWALAITILGLSMISLRGMMTAVAVFMFDGLYRTLKMPAETPRFRFYLVKNYADRLLFYLPGGVFAFAFLVWHYQIKGWIGYFPGSTWAPAFERVGVAGLVKNIAILIWRLLDFGYFAIWIVAGYLLIRSFLSIGVNQLQRIQTVSAFAETKPALLALVCAFIFLTPTLLIYKGLLNHRYLLPVYLTATIVCFQEIMALKDIGLRRTLYALVFLSLFAGGFLVYPQPVATGWDATPAHLPYYTLRTQMLQFIAGRHIPISCIGTAFPNRRPFRDVDLTDSDDASFAEKDFQRNDYIFYSNVMNDFTEQELQTLRTDWTAVKTFRQGAVTVILYKK